MSAATAMAGSTSRKRLLIVEDDPGLAGQLRWGFDGFEIENATTRDEALAAVRRFEPQVVTLDLGLPPDPGGVTEGMETLREILALTPETKIIVVTGNDERAHAVQAVGLGAYDFCQKPIDPDTLRLIVERAWQLHELEAENRRLLVARTSSPLGGVVCASEEMHAICRIVERVAPTNVTVLLYGESGTGKEVLARALHEMSPRRGKPFVAINSAAIPETLLESELFGYEKGAFTGASRQTPGKIEHADGGTFFLDEVGDLPMSLQAKLLRFLQERTVDRLGGRVPIPVDVRVICATHCDLPTRIREGRFREDLYYRLSEITIRLPPLRERYGDAVVLARTFLDRYAQQNGRVHLKGFSRDAIEAIEAYPWPGNVRELENRVKRAVIMADGKQVTAPDMELDLNDLDPVPLNLREVRERAERQAVARALAQCDNKVAQAAELLGVTRPTLYSLLTKHGITVETNTNT